MDCSREFEGEKEEGEKPDGVIGEAKHDSDNTDTSGKIQVFIVPCIVPKTCRTTRSGFSPFPV